MTDAEVGDLLAVERVVVCATNGPEGWPHLMPLWYVVREGRVWAWTYGKSQKVRNLDRDPRCTLQVETGTEYAELRGVMLRCQAVIHREPEVVEGVGLELAERYGGARPEGAMREAFRAQVSKRVGLEFVERGRATWDHRKLAGGY